MDDFLIAFTIVIFSFCVIATVFVWYDRKKKKHGR